MTNASNTSRGMRMVLYRRLWRRSGLSKTRTPLRVSNRRIMVSVETRRMLAASWGVKYSEMICRVVPIGTVLRIKYGNLPLPSESDLPGLSYFGNAVGDMEYSHNPILCLDYHKYREAVNQREGQNQPTLHYGWCSPNRFTLLLPYYSVERAFLAFCALVFSVSYRL
jgi:hypothetical protein